MPVPKKKSLTGQPEPKRSKIKTPLVRPTLTAWSYSRWKKYEECPAALAYEVFDKRKPEQNKYMARGSDIHKEGETYVKRERRDVPGSFEKYKEELKKLVKLKATAEESWGFTKDWEPTHWFESDCKPDRMVWARIKTDAHVPLPKNIIEIIDYKTGQVREKGNEPQLELYALGGFKMFDGVKLVRASLWFLDWHVTVSRDYPLSIAKDLEKKWNARVAPMMEDTKFVPRPGPQCARCMHNVYKGGPCEAPRSLK